MKKLVAALAAVWVLSLAAYASVASDWAAESIYAADNLGIVSIGDFPDYTAPVTREEICELAVKTYEKAIGEPVPVLAGENPFKDIDSAYVIAAAQLGLVSGRDPFVFDGVGNINREESAKLFVVLAEALGLEPGGESESFYDIYSVSSWAADYVKKASAYGYLTADYKGEFLPFQELTAEQAITVLIRIYSDAVPSYKPDIRGTGLTKEKKAEPRDGLFQYNGKYKKNDPAKVFTDGEITSKAEADAQMVEITVDIWELKNGEKVSGKMELTVHKNIADTVKAVFDDIYNGEEKFPIDKGSTYCYYFRNTAGSGRLSEHATGTAIDINPDQNYCIYSNGSTVGSLYEPGDNPYSIEKYGDCWSAFVSHGFTWGGDAWDSPQDYMHFSYLGK